MQSDNSTLNRGNDGRIEPEQLSGVSSPSVTSDENVFGPGADAGYNGEVEHTKVEEAIANYIADNN